MMSARRVTPALFTRMSICPNTSKASSHHAVDVPQIADIRLHRQAATLRRRYGFRGRFSLLTGNIRDDDMRASLGQRECGSPADALAGAGHQRDLIG